MDFYNAKIYVITWQVAKNLKNYLPWNSQHNKSKVIKILEN